MTIEINGTIKEIFQTENVSEKFAKKVIAVTTDESSNYPQHLSIEAHNKSIDLLDSISVGDSVTITANLNGRVWVDKEGKNKYFNTISIYKITKN